MKEKGYTSGQRRLRALLLGGGVLGLLIFVASIYSNYEPSSFPCFSGFSTTYLDLKHPKGFRTVVSSAQDSNFLTIEGRNSGHGDAATFKVGALYHFGTAA
jgi:hypothetical protein